MHLRDADALADLRLREVLGEAQPEHFTLAVAQHGHQPLDGGGVLGEAEARILDAERLGHPLAVIVVVAWSVERDGTGGAGRPARPAPTPSAPRSPSSSSSRGRSSETAG